MSQDGPGTPVKALDMALVKDSRAAGEFIMQQKLCGKARPVASSTSVNLLI
jgi:hypothetical protein